MAKLKDLLSPQTNKTELSEPFRICRPEFSLPDPDGVGNWDG